MAREAIGTGYALGVQVAETVRRRRSLGFVVSETTGVLVDQIDAQLDGKLTTPVEDLAAHHVVHELDVCEEGLRRATKIKDDSHQTEALEITRMSLAIAARAVIRGLDPDEQTWYETTGDDVWRFMNLLSHHYRQGSLLDLGLKPDEPRTQLLSDAMRAELTRQQMTL